MLAILAMGPTLLAAENASNQVKQGIYGEYTEAGQGECKRMVTAVEIPDPGTQLESARASRIAMNIWAGGKLRAGSQGMSKQASTPPQAQTRALSTV